MTARPGAQSPDWLEVLEGSAPILLIAPHGGRAGPHADAILAPRVNDLHTAEMTRELAGRLGAAALLNTGMDRNRVDCNRVGDVVAHAPWLLAMIAERLERMVSAEGRALVLAIHGWNLVEARVDIGVGLTERTGRLAPSRGAQVSVSDRFLSGTLAALVDRLGRAGIVSTFGLRYPAGGAQNLLQAFTRRHLESEIDALHRIAALGARGVIEAVQLELSIALRFPGMLRDRAIEGLTEVLSGGGNGAMHNGKHPRLAHQASGAPPAHRPRPAVHKSARLGFEFYDPASRIGAMASFDLGAGGGGGGRVMILTPEGAVVLFTGERGSHRESAALSVGPLRLRADGARLGLEFAGPMLLTPEADAYVNIERALSLSSLETETTFAVEFALDAPFDLEAVRAGAEADGAHGIAVHFGSFSGRLRIGTRDYSMSGVARIGPAFTALDDGGFEARRMLWVMSARGDDSCAIQAAEWSVDGAWRPAAAGSECRIIALDPPHGIRAALATPRGRELPIAGHVVSRVPLMRSDSRGQRFHTSIGFAEFTVGRRRGFGMFETSRRADDRASAIDAETEAG